MAAERYLSSTVLEANDNQQYDEVRELFAGLPIAQNAKLDWLSHFVPPDVPMEEVRQKVIDRAISLNQKFKIGVIDLDVALATLDDKVFTEFEKEQEEKKENLKTARHEVGHKVVAQLLGWSVTKITVVAEGKTLGLTISEPPPNLTFQAWLLGSAAISFGGAIAAEMMEDPVLGTGFDMASAEAKARIAVQLGYYASEAAFLSEARNIAHGALRAFGQSNIERQANLLSHRGTMAA